MWKGAIVTGKSISEFGDYADYLDEIRKGTRDVEKTYKRLKEAVITPEKAPLRN